MLKRAWLVILLSIFTVFTACAGKEEIRPSEEAEASFKVIEKIQLLEDIYSKRDTVKLKTLMGEDLFNKIRSNMDFREVKLNISYPRIIWISNEKIRVNLNWNGEWIFSNKTLRRSGLGIFIFDRESMKLIDINGDNPFVPLEIE